MGSSTDKESLGKRSLENTFDKENASFGANVDVRDGSDDHHRMTLSAISMPKLASSSDTILRDSSPQPRPYNPHCGELERHRDVYARRGGELEEDDAACAFDALAFTARS